ncbi:bifunctional phosphoribosylaminoimidazolecarboxamide formyltransferase/IMP cyclohydrolase [Bacillus safensis]|uniref:bifunctional phosphoribosylaminoimidazolecarboxamide formyltransferase/IMP cyclohydrolase n=1 Tax=Bacillus safensis TaxID=561879 RepID=UPI00223856CE|nr:bifunctional phosphoribosylaminoimidazolecarboxamide formyltransferase/IMP cyclohydrolase [Bacillus safensis]MCW4644833.1 bifunctional phosphoribosylaminoimidazolecarboxamide formyltransferase/IMP cyclohydrolase [Bacillus safensis]MCY7564978.1 bifunctional phosphoribosylaminoimidazolecarboxamide formyltransferase/IMP cyclohydrolase [Bacillus safensis]MCY7624526.1 bifunctional phosphoribosylaminoimidazolecarboxamide formyltransferase/IMP cyclohydrolase [Bacillus safensis]MCY7632157.1 bifuncti
MTIKRALISVSDKTNLVPFVKELTELGVEVISTGGTHKLLQENGIDVIGISEVTGFPEIMDGRLKTLHPNIHGGLLAVRENDEHMAQIEKHGIQPIDLVVVNLYPFKETISKDDVTYEEAIENIDIGGPGMLRAASKNHQDVTVIVDPRDYDTVIQQIKEGVVSLEKKRELAAKVFRHTAAYDALIADYLTNFVGETEPEQFTVTFEKKQSLRYGENPHQAATFYENALSAKGSLATAKQLHGKELSYNNIKDADAALQIVREFTEPAAVAVKHMNPCGVGTGETIAEAFDRAFKADETSIFGGIVALNREVDKQTAEVLHTIFLEIVIAPSFSQEALDVLTAKKNLRLLTLDVEADLGKKEKQLTSVHGGLLVQDIDTYGLEEATISIPTKREPTEDEWKDLKLAWKVVKHVKSNAIVLAKDQMTAGIGAGQMNRVGSANIAIEQAGEKAKGSALGSDAFFPMGDTVEAAAKAGVTAIIQPGGSIRDEESIQKADEYGIAMVFTGVRHFKH